MDDKDHLTLLKTLLELEGMVMLSGYPSELYDDTLKNWKRVETKQEFLLVAVLMFVLNVFGLIQLLNIMTYLEVQLD